MTDTRITPRLLLVDDTRANLDVLVGILKADYQLQVALDGQTALQLAQEYRPDLILLDIMMPDLNGFEICQRLKANPLTAKIPIIFVTALHESQDEAKGLELGAVDYLIKPVNAAIVRARVATHLALYNQTQYLEHLVQQRTQALAQAQLHAVQSLGRAAEYKDEETGLHVVRMSHYSQLLAQEFGLPDHFCQLIFNAAPMHDVGKIGIPDPILKKQGPLDEQEWQIMQSHPELGAKILGHLDSELMQMARSIALTHHEHWDGSGYPNGLVGAEIPLAGRIVAIADVFDALTSARPYKQAWPMEKAFEYLQIQQGKHFDPELIQCFISIKEPVTEISCQHRARH